MARQPLTLGGRLNFVEPLTERRASYNELLTLFAERFGTDPNAMDKIVPFPSDLRSDIQMVGGNVQPTEVEFAFRSDQPNAGASSISPAENRLDINDAFYITHMALMWGCWTVAGTAPTSAYMQQWPNPTLPTGAVGGGLGPSGAAAALRAYNGTMSGELNAVKFMDQLSLLNFMNSAEAQSGLAVSDVVTTGVMYGNDFGNLKGWYELVPGLLFSGSDKMRIKVRIPEPLSFALASHTITMSLQLKGLRIQNYESAGQ